MKTETEQSKNYVIHSDNKSSLKSETLTILITEQKYLCKILAMDFQSKWFFFKDWTHISIGKVQK